MNILFVCLGNICRSPSAEGIFKALVKTEGLENDIEIDSAGMIGFHAGNPADARMKRHAAEQGYDLCSISRPFDARVDYDRFDMIIGMDSQNMSDLKAVARHQADLDKLSLMTDYLTEMSATHVPDPYYGGDDGFRHVIRLLEDACAGLLAEVRLAV